MTSHVRALIAVDRGDGRAVSCIAAQVSNWAKQWSISPHRGVQYGTCTDAKARLTDLVRSAEAGEEVVIARHGHAVVRLVALRARSSVEDRAEVISAVRARAAAKVAEGPTAARSRDCLYDHEGRTR